jgi:hypothetical protein
MTYAGGSGTDFIGFKDILVAEPPWIRDANIRDAYIANAINLNLNPSGFTRGGAPGQAINSGGWAKTRGTNPANPISCTWQNGFAGKELGYVQCGPNTSAYVAADPLGVAMSGTAVPISIVICAQLPVASTNVNWCLFYFGRSSTATPAFSATGAPGSTNFGIARRNDAANVVGGGVIAPGTSPFVLYVKYTGTTLTTRLNRVTIDNALAFNGGALTCDQCAFGAQHSTVVNGWCNPNIYAWFDSIGTNMPDASVVALENYLCRLIGL